MTLVASNRPYLKPGSSKPGRCQSTTPLKHAPVHLPVPLDQWISDWTELFRFLFLGETYRLGRECNSVGRVLT